MSDFYYDENRIYRCVKCGEPFSPSHTARCHPTIPGRQPLQLKKANGEKLETGMKMLHSCQQTDPPELGGLLR